MNISEVKTLNEVSEEYGIKIITLKKRLELKSFGLIDGEDYKKLGHRQATILSPSGVEKITKERSSYHEI
ncbi:MAG: hypothetical protein RR620_13105 [Clostridium sp.]